MTERAKRGIEKASDRYYVGSALTSEQIVEVLAKICEKWGAQAEFARKAGCSRALVNAILTGNRPPCGKVLKALGVERFVRYIVK